MRIGVHAGHNPDGKIGCGAIGLIKESTENRNVKNEVIRLLKLAGHTVYDCTVDNGTSVSDIVNKQVKKSNAQTLDLTVSIHFNSGANDKSGNGTTTGVEVLMSSIDGIKKSIGEKICSNVSKLGYRNRGCKKRTNLGFLTKTKAKAILVECCFVDDADDVKKYNYKTMAKAIAEGIHGSAIKETTTSTKFVIGSYQKDVITTDNLNCRSGRGSSYKILKTFAKGTKVNVWYIDKASDGSLWGSCNSGVKDVNGKSITGYIHMGYTKPL